MPQIFISYRTSDSETIAGRIYDNLKYKYGPASVWIDYESMIPGRDFRARIAELLHKSDILTAIIGKTWTGPLNSERRVFWKRPSRQYRIYQEDDWVRYEVETAMKRPIPVIPVLVHGAAMPSPAMLPDSLKEFSFLHAHQVSDREGFGPTIRKLFEAIDGLAQSTSNSMPSPSELPPPHVGRD